MQVSQDMLQQYLGGLIEIQNRRDAFMHRGEVASVRLDGRQLSVGLAWRKQGIGFSGEIVYWEEHPGGVQVVDMDGCDIRVQHGSLVIHSTQLRETVTFSKPK